jgi:hypothetical protein
MENEEYPYQKAWRQYRLLNRLLLVMVPLMFLPFVLLALTNSEIIENVLAFVGVLSFLIFVVINLKIVFWNCPRCHSFYFRWWQRMQMVFAKECKNCGLKKYEGSNITGS